MSRANRTIMLPITNEARSASWGSRSLIAGFFGREPTGEAEAEVWFGAHPESPSRIVAGEYAGQTLDRALADLGSEQPRMLLKVLAAAESLSLQAHPTTEQAEVGFEREEAAGIPRDAPRRSYRDPHAKPELIVAVTPFEALCGFRGAAAEPVFDALAAVDERVRPAAEQLRAGMAFEWLLGGGRPVEDAVAGAVEWAASLPDEFEREADTIERLSRAHPGDAGILTALLLHRVTLAPGEALFLPAGNVHAYLEGLGIELMGPSDNVLRGGLTPKHVDVPELLAVADRRTLGDPRLQSTPLDGAIAYRPVAPFELRHIQGEHEVEAGLRGVLLAASPASVRAQEDAWQLPAAGAAWLELPAPARVSSDDAWLALERDTPGNT